MNVSCSAKSNACPILLSSACVFYEGENLIYTGINTNDTVETALEKIDARFANLIFTVNVIAPLQKTGTINTIISIPKATSLVDGYLSSTDWSTFNSKQNQLNGVGFVKANGTTITYDNSTYYLASNPNNFIPLTALSSAATGLTYTNTTGVFTLTPGYVIPTTTEQTNWNTAYANRISSLTTTGSSGAATLLANVLNIPNYTLAGLGGVPTTRTLTINGVAFDLSANRSWTIDALPSQTGNSGKYLTTNGTIASWGVISTDNIYNANGTLTSARTLTSGGFPLTFTGSNTAATAIARGLNLTHTLVAAANSDVLVGLDINPTFTNGAFTGVNNYGLRVINSQAFFGGLGGIAMFIESNSAIRGNATSGGTIYFDASRDTTGTLNFRGTTLVFPGGSMTTSDFNITSISSLFTSQSFILRNSGVSSFRLNNTTSATTWYFENNRNAPSGSLEITNSLTNAGLTLFSTRNVGINTNTDAGYKLDVQGTARVTLPLQVDSRSIKTANTTAAYYFQGSALWLGSFGCDATTGNPSVYDQNSNKVVIGNTSQWATNVNSNLICIGMSQNGGNGVYGGIVIGNSSALQSGSGYRHDLNIVIGHSSGIGFSGAFNTGKNIVIGNSSQTTSQPNANKLTIIGNDINSDLANAVILGDTTQSVIIGSYAGLSSSAKVQIDSTTKGFLSPRLTTTQRDAIVSPATGLSIYNTTTNTSDYYNGTAWSSLSTVNIYNSDGTLSGNRIVNTGSNLLTFTNGSNGLKFGSATISGLPVFYAIYGSNLTPSSTNYTLALDQNGNFTFLNANINLGLQTSGVTRAILTNAGRLLLGTASEDTFLLDVNGTARVSGNVLNESNSTTLGVLGIGRLSNPSQPSATANTTGGTLADGTYYYKIVALDNLGNTTAASTERSVTITGGGGAGSVTLTLIKVNGVVSYRIYRGTTSSGQNIYYTFNVSWATGEFFTDTGAASTAGTPPSINTTLASNISLSDGVNFAGSDGLLLQVKSGGPNSDYGVLRLSKRQAPVIIGTAGPNMPLGGSGTGILIHSSNGSLGAANYTLSNSILIVNNGNAFSGTATNSLVISSNWDGDGNPNNILYLNAGNSAKTIMISGTYNNIGLGNNSSSLTNGTYSNSVVIGTSSISNVYFNSVVNTSVAGITINGVGASGNDVGGGNITIAGGKGTGTGTSGDIILATATPTSTGTTLQTLTNRVWIKGQTGNVGIGASPDAAYKLDVTGNFRAKAVESRFEDSVYGTVWRFRDTKAFFASTTDPGPNGLTVGGTINTDGSFIGTGNITVGGVCTVGSKGFPYSQTILSKTSLFISNYNNSDRFYYDIYYTNNISNALSKAFNIRIFGGQSSVDYGDVILCYNGTQAVGNTLIGTQTSVTSAILNVSSTTQGFLPPRMTTTQKNAIATPAAGLQVYDATLNVPSYYNGTAWVNPGSGSGTVTSVATTGPITGGTITTSGTIGITQATTSTDGYLSSTDWNIFNGKQPQLNGTGFVKASGTTITYDNSTYYLASNPSGFLNYNIYTSNGTLSGNRVVTMGVNTLSFEKDLLINGLTIGKGNNSVATNTVLGVSAGSTIAAATRSVFIGYEAGKNVTTGAAYTGSVLIGYQAGLNMTTGYWNVMIGDWSGRDLTTGTRNTLVGEASGYKITTASGNTVIGDGAGAGITTGGNNTILGVNSAQSITTGTYNIVVGSASSVITTGSYNTFIGNSLSGISPTLSNNIILADGQGNMRLVVDNGGNVSIGGSTTYPTFSGSKLDVNGTVNVTGNVGIGAVPVAISSLQVATPNQWSGSFVGNLGGARTPSQTYGIHLGWNYTGGSGESNIVWGTVTGASTPFPYLVFSTWDGTTKTDRVEFQDTGKVVFKNYQTATSFTGTAVGHLAFDSGGNIITVPVPSSVNIYNSNGSLDSTRTVTIGDHSLAFSKTQASLTGANDFVGTSIVSAPTTNASITWTALKGFFNYQGIFSPTFGGNITFQNSNYAGQELKINRITFAAASSAVTMTQGSGGVRAFSNAIIHNYIDGTNDGTITHFASLAMYGDFASSSAKFTFGNRYGLLINDFQEYNQGHTYIKRWAIYQAGIDDLNYFSSKLLIGTATDIASAKVVIDSTAQGFLPPRMTTTQINAITSPAEGLIVFNTTISHLCCYQGGDWVKINHSPM